jgi:hypothetical protein
MSVTISAWKRCSVRLYLQLLVGGSMSYLRYLCLFAHSGVQRILCCVFALFFFVLYNLCCQFLWIILFWLPLVFSNIYLCVRVPIFSLSTILIFDLGIDTTVWYVLFWIDTTVWYVLFWIDTTVRYVLFWIDTTVWYVLFWIDTTVWYVLFWIDTTVWYVLAYVLLL